jgi:hypothetical protein
MTSAVVVVAVSTVAQCILRVLRIPTLTSTWEGFERCIATATLQEQVVSVVVVG